MEEGGASRSTEPEKKQITVVTGCVIDKGRVLLSQRLEPELPDADRKWDLPGGKAEFGEFAIEAVKREVKEETGLDVEPTEMVPYVHTNVWRYEERLLSVILICYVCRLTGHETKIRRQASEARRVEWVEIGDIDLRKSLPGIREFLAWVAEKKFGIRVTTSVNYRYAHLECVVPEQNMDRFYLLSDRAPTMLKRSGGGGPQLTLFSGGAESEASPMTNPAFVVRRSWGRRGWTPKTILEEYYSERAVVRRFDEILKIRQTKGYQVVESNLGQSFDEIFLTLAGDLERLATFDRHDGDTSTRGEMLGEGSK